MMRKQLAYFAVRLLTIIIALTPLTVLADDGPDQRPLKDKENPLMIGQRDINKGLWQINFYSVEKEIALGQQLAAEIDQQSRLIDDPMITEYINRVGQNIVLHSDAQIPFTIKVIASDEINAFALPGGYFYVNTGLIMAADNEAELVGVMAHEIAHVTARHAVENFSKSQLLQFATIPLIFVGGGVVGQLAQLGASFGLPLTFFKFSRGAEKEADRLGAQYAWASGYDPNNLLTFFEKLQAKQEKEPNAFSKLFLTHPPTSDRIEKVKDLLTRFPERDEYIINTSEFHQVKARLARINASTRTLGDTPAESERPTLKRHPTDQSPSSDEPPEQEDAPVLKKRDS